MSSFPRKREPSAFARTGPESGKSLGSRFRGNDDQGRSSKSRTRVPNPSPKFPTSPPPAPQPTPNPTHTPTPPTHTPHATSTKPKTQTTHMTIPYSTAEPARHPHRTPPTTT